MILRYVVAILLLFTLSFVHAADLRGKLTGISDAEVHADCAGYTASTAISSNGSFFISDLPPNNSCHFIVKAGKLMSARTSFNTKNSTNTFDGKLKKFNNKILVIFK